VSPGLRRCVTRVQGGLGNQLFCYAQGRRVVDQFGGELVLDISGLERGDTYGRRFELPQVGIRCATLTSQWLADPQGRLIRRVMRTLFRRHVYREPAVPTRGATLPDWIYLDGYWQADPEINNQRAALCREIDVAPLLQSRDTIALAARLTAERGIGVHMRSYREERVAFRRSVPSARYFFDGVERIFAEYGSRPVFVASDESFQPGEAPKAIRDCLVPVPRQRSQFEDLHLLRSCSFHVLCNSTFGWWGAFLAESVCTYYPRNAGYFHYPAPAHNWRVIPDPGAA
jgi:hypothetical protein